MYVKKHTPLWFVVTNTPRRACTYISFVITNIIEQNEKSLRLGGNNNMISRMPNSMGQTPTQGPNQLNQNHIFKSCYI